jgi:diguanylate cyclase (GGDEF)-like protein
MTTARLSVRLSGALILVAVVVAIGWVLAAPPVYAEAAQLAAGLLAAYACLASARNRDRTASARRWRLLLGLGFLGWSAARVLWLLDTGFADAGLVAMPVLAYLAVLSAATAMRRPGPTSARRDVIVLAIDGVLVAGSIVALTWSALPDRVFQNLHESPWAAGLAMAYPIADLILAIMVVLLLTTRPAPRPGRVPLWLAAGGFVAIGVADMLRLVQLTGGLTILESAGYLIGPVLIALAAGYPPGRGDETEVIRVEADWLHLLLPYVPVITTGVVIAVRTASAGGLSPFEAYLGWLGLGLVVARQMFTIVDNTVLLARVSEGQQRLRHQAYHDPLTGLANRALFRERLVVALDAHRRQRRPVALLFADLDDFKLINDSFGHAMGDRLLHAIADRLHGCVPPEDLVARLGGDEFAVLLEHRPEDAEPIGHRILAALHDPFVIDGQTVGVGASIGLVVPDSSDTALTADGLLRRADAAMYVSKRRGKGNLARYAGGADGGPHADLPHLLARALGGAPAASGFEVFYQPIVRFTDGATVAVEALARWTDPVHGPVDPDVFVTVAERTGLVGAIDDFVLDRACADAATLANTYGRPIDVHVNVSAARLGQPGLEEALLRALERHAVRASRLVVEITETRRIPDLPRAAAVAARLRAYGIRIALDDFGSGFNALAQLHSLPVDIVKLDSSLTDVDVDPVQAAALCRSVLAICNELNVTVVAEGIETPARAHALAMLGCPLGQGYLFGQPRPVHRLAVPVVPAQQHSRTHLAS